MYRVLGAPILCVTGAGFGSWGPQFYALQELARCLVGGPLDVVMLQEHHLSESRIKRCGKLLKGHGEAFWSAAFGPSGIQGGVCIPIVEPWDKESDRARQGAVDYYAEGQHALGISQ